MATMRGDVTQDINPVVADYSPQIRAMKAGAEAAQVAADAKIKMAELASGTITSLYDMYKTKQMQDVRNQASDLTTEFRSSNVQAQQEQVAAQQKMREITSYGMATGGGLSTAERDDEIVAISEQVKRLKEAKKGGMSSTQYLSRLHTLTKKSIASLPFKADQIRGIIASETGLGKDTIDEGLYFVKEQFSPTKTGSDPLDPAKMLAKAIDGMTNKGFGDQMTLRAMYEQDPEAFQAKLKSYNEQLGIEQQNATLQANVEGMQITDSQFAKAATPQIRAIMVGTIALGLSKEAGNKESGLWKIADLIQAGAVDVSAPAYKAAAGMLSTKLLRVIEEQRLSARANINSFLEQRQNVPPDQQKAMYQAIEDEAASLSKRYLDKDGAGIRAMAAVFSAYKDEALGQQMKRVELAMNAMRVMPQSFVEAVIAGGTAEQQIRRDFPDAWKMIKANQAVAAQGTGEASAMLDHGSDLASINALVNQAQVTGEPVTPVATVGNQAPTEKETSINKAAVDVVVGNAMQIINNKADLDAIDVNVISSALTTMVATGGQKNQLMKNYTRLGNTLREKLTVEDLAVLKGNVSRASGNSVANIRQIRDVLNAKYGTNYNIGVSEEGLLYLNSRSTAVAVRDPQAMAIAEEFKKLANPMAVTTVFGRAMLTEEDPAAIGQELALAINTGQDYKPFYDGQGVVPTTTSNVKEETAAPAAAAVAEPAPNTSNDLKYDTQGDLKKIIDKNEALGTSAGKKKADEELAKEEPEFKPKGLAITSVYKDFPSQTYGVTASANKKPFAGVVLHHDPAKNMSYYGQVDKVRKGQFGYHFTIAEDGTIYQAAPMNARTNHIGNKGFEGLREDSPLDNSNAIGIAYLGGENPSPQATEAIKKLMAKLKGQYGDLVTASHPSVSKAGHKSEGEGAVWKDALAKEGFRVM